MSQSPNNSRRYDFESMYTKSYFQRHIDMSFKHMLEHLMMYPNYGDLYDSLQAAIELYFLQCDQFRADHIEYSAYLEGLCNANPGWELCNVNRHFLALTREGHETNFDIHQNLDHSIEIDFDIGSLVHINCLIGEFTCPMYDNEQFGIEQDILLTPEFISKTRAYLRNSHEIDKTKHIFYDAKRKLVSQTTLDYFGFVRELLDSGAESVMVGTTEIFGYTFYPNEKELYQQYAYHMNRSGDSLYFNVLSMIGGVSWQEHDAMIRQVKMLRYQNSTQANASALHAS